MKKKIKGLFRVTASDLQSVQYMAPICLYGQSCTKKYEDLYLELWRTYVLSNL